MSTWRFTIRLPREAKKALYLRSAYRNDPEFQIRRLSRTGDPLDEVRVNRMIDNDAAVGRNYQRLASQGLEDSLCCERTDLQPSTSTGKRASGASGSR